MTAPTVPPAPDFDRHHRFQQDRMRVSIAFLNAIDAGNLKRHFRRIDDVVGPVVYRHPHVHHRKPRERAMLHGLDDPLLHCRNKIPGDDAAHDPVRKREPLPALRRRQLQPAITVLPVAPVCFLYLPWACAVLRIVSR